MLKTGRFLMGHLIPLQFKKFSKRAQVEKKIGEDLYRGVNNLVQLVVDPSEQELFRREFHQLRNILPLQQEVHQPRHVADCDLGCSK